MSEVAQADRDDRDDRDWAADALAEMGVDWGACGDVREGRVGHPLVAVFARHRIAAEAAAYEAAARYVKCMPSRVPMPDRVYPSHQELNDYGDVIGWIPERTVKVTRIVGTSDIAAAIRALALDASATGDDARPTG